MFKNASNIAQFRERKNALDSHKNSTGIDESMFRGSNKTTDKHYDLVLQKKGIEHKIHTLKAQISIANRRNAQGRVNYKTMNRWEAELVNLRAAASGVDLKLTEMRVERQLQAVEEHKSYADCFVAVAKEMLVEDAYSRIAIAAVHRAREMSMDTDK